MIWILAGIILLVLGGVVVLLADLRTTLHLIDELRSEARDERAKLLDRIQHPERLQVPLGETIEYDPPKDAVELAQVGQIVPEFIQVGGGDASH